MRIGDIQVGEGHPLLLIAGPCVIEGEAQTLAAARKVADVAQRQGLPAVFKCSFDKANRTSGKSFRGPGLTQGLRVLAKVKQETGLPILTDVHDVAQCAAADTACAGSACSCNPPTWWNAARYAGSIAHVVYGAKSANARSVRCESSRGNSSAPSPSISTPLPFEGEASSTVTSFQSSSAAAAVSKPGPRFAVEAGATTRTVKRAPRAPRPA